MTVHAFIDLFRQAFGRRPDLPLAFWYDDTPAAKPARTFGCFFSRLREARTGSPVALSSDTMTCGGGKLYTGFGEMPPHVPAFVSTTERYKQTPDQVLSYVASLDLRPAPGRYLNFARIDRLDSFDGIEGLLFFATPDLLSGLCTWACYDNDARDAVCAPFGSGCSSVVAMTVRENRHNGRSCLLGCFDPSVRPHLNADELSFVIPRSRLRTMLDTLPRCCLSGTWAWSKVRERIDRGRDD